MVCSTHLKQNVAPSPFQADSYNFLWLVSHPLDGLAKSLFLGLCPPPYPHVINPEPGSSILHSLVQTFSLCWGVSSQ